MALSQSSTLTFSATQVVLTNTTGDYDNPDNLGGYGTPNPAFADLAHYAIIRKKNVGEDAEDELLTLDSYNPITATSFTATRTDDGWHEGVLIDIIIWTAGTYAAGQVRYYNGGIWMANTSTTGTPGVSPDWDSVSLEDIEENDSVYAYAYGRSTAYNSDTYWSREIAKNSQRGRCGICEDDRQKERLDRIEFHINAVLVADQQGNNQDAEFNSLALVELGAVLEDE